ncbi:MAG: hypothetical protein AAF975_07140 [Spirochaetota bacterium]
MTGYQRLEAVRDKLKTGVPALLGANKLPDFAAYEIGEPFATDESRVGVFTLEWSMEPERETWACCVLFQCYEVDEVYHYESVLLPELPRLLPPEALGMTLFQNIESIVSPPGQSSSTFIFISLSYSRELDDSENF